MKLKVSAIWRLFTIILIGFCLGVWVTVKYISPPSQDINIGKITVKGRGNTVGKILDISRPTTDTPAENTTEITPDTLNKKAVRKAKKAARKAARIARKNK